MIYFDNSATTYPKPQQVTEAVKKGVLLYGGNPGRSGHDISIRVSDMVFAVRVKLGEMFGALPERVVFTENCTMSLNTAIGSIPACSDVITTDLEHNAVIRPLEAARKQGRLRYRILPTGRDNCGLISRLSAMLRPDTKAVVMTAASNVTGRILPVREVGAFCKRHGIRLIVDAAQAAGVIPLNCKQDNIDVLCMSGHKGLYGITGTGVLLAGENVNLKPLIYGGTGTESLSPVQPDMLPEALESGTIPTVGICALDAGLSYLQTHGIEKLTRRNLELCRMLYEALSAMPQATIYSPKPEWGICVPIVAFSIAGEPSETTAAKLNEHGFALRGGYQCAAVTHRKLHTMDTGVVRFSPSCFNTRQEVGQLIQALKQIVAKK